MGQPLNAVTARSLAVSAEQPFETDFVHRDIPSDPSGFDLFAIEARARAMRAQVVAGALQALWARIRPVSGRGRRQDRSARGGKLLHT